MARTNIPKKPTAILCGDIHLREDQPVCRTDDYFAAQARKIAWLRDLQARHGCPIIDSGDLFHHWKPSPSLITWAIENLPADMTTVPGNHDLPAHSLELYKKSGLACLEAAGAVLSLTEPDSCFLDLDGKYQLAAAIHPFPWGATQKPLVGEKTNHFPDVAVMHTMAYTGELPYPGCPVECDALSLLKRMSGYDLVLTGHNHIPFVVEHNGRLLVNPGSLMRSTALQVEHRPRVYLWYAEDNRVEPEYVPIEEGVVSRDHIEAPEYRDARTEAFVSSLCGDFETSLSFESNLEKFFEKNRIRSGVQQLVWAAVKGE